MRVEDGGFGRATKEDRVPKFRHIEGTHMKEPEGSRAIREGTPMSIRMYGGCALPIEHERHCSRVQTI